MTRNSRRIRSLLLAAATILCGLIWRLAPLHPPPFALKYGGSALYATMLYWLIAAAAPELRRLPLSIAALGSAWAIEFFKLVRRPGLDDFRLTLPGKLILGRFFSVGALVAYAVAIAAVALIDGATSGRAATDLSSHRSRP